MAAAIAEHPTVRELYARAARRGGRRHRRSEADELDADVLDAAEARRTSALKETFGRRPRRARDGRIPAGDGGRGRRPRSPADRLRELNEELLRVPDGSRRTRSCCSSSSAAATRSTRAASTGARPRRSRSRRCSSTGIPIRLTGQDTERGTFSHRHVVLHDVEHGRDATRRCSTSTRRRRRSRSTTRRSPSTRASASSTATRPRRRRRSCSGRRSSATSSTARRSSSTSSSSPGLSKWGETSRLTLLLPHGYEGNGPEHSSARLERFLQLAAQENIRIANCTTAAQYFHLLRRQALDATARPLVVMTPKGLLRLKQASSTLDDLADGAFQPVLDDPRADHERVHAARPLLREDLLRHRRPRGRARAPTTSRSRASSSSTRSRSSRRAALVARYPNLARGRLGAGGAAEHGRLARDPPPARGGEARRRAAPLRRPPVAREPERGLPDGAPARAGPDRPRGARAVGALCA